MKKLNKTVRRIIAVLVGLGVLDFLTLFPAGGDIVKATLASLAMILFMAILLGGVALVVFLWG